jgi:hypothetical protein
MNAELAGYSDYIREKIGQIHEILGGLTDDELNRAPDLPGANSPFVIATHTFGNIRSGVLGIVCGQDLTRDRPSEFISQGTYGEIGEASRQLSAGVNEALRKLDPESLDDRFIPSQKLWGEGEPWEMSRREELLHVLEHAGIHLGHIQMTIAMLRR